MDGSCFLFVFVYIYTAYYLFPYPKCVYMHHQYENVNKIVITESFRFSSSGMYLPPSIVKIGSPCFRYQTSKKNIFYFVSTYMQAAKNIVYSYILRAHIKIKTFIQTYWIYRLIYRPSITNDTKYPTDPAGGLYRMNSYIQQTARASLFSLFYFALDFLFFFIYSHIIFFFLWQ